MSAAESPFHLAPALCPQERENYRQGEETRT